MDRKKLTDISNRILDIISVLEVVKDSCIANDFYSQEYVITLAINKQQEIFDEMDKITGQMLLEELEQKEEANGSCC